MASKPSLPASLLRTYTSLLSRRTSQLQFQASRLLGVELQSQSQDVWRRHVESVARGIERMSGTGRLQAIPVQAQNGIGQRRWHSTDFGKRSKDYQFDDILAILETPSDSRLLIDVREPHEYDANTIPTAINLPISSHPDALLLTEEEFQDQFGFAKPPLTKEVVFFCKAGVRSSAAAGIARQAGYTNVGEYRGSFLDWERRGGPGTKTPPTPGGRGEAQLPVQETKPVRGKGDSGEEDLGEQGAPPYPEGATTPRQ
ncbi:Rhodanese-like protein [Ophiobolus disseminans]|uniref:Rhodanese-like protein n=1 Tax=Ophiobolus disseminans TaxID=1469910 RepID=A0A6A6ZKA2_9PLEO|nr:Rhodanese-like protein [Ophiobolus disseminans]